MLKNKNLDNGAENAPVVDLEERTWLPRHHNGEAGYFTKLLRRYQKPLYSYLYHCGFTPAICDELFQEICLNIHKGAGSYQSSRPLKPWLFTVAANVIRNHVRARRPETSEVEDYMTVDTTNDPERQLQTDDMLRWTEHQIQQLPLHQKQVLLLRVVQNLSLDEITEALNIPLNTVKTHLRRARLTLTRERMAFEEANPVGTGAGSQS